jgi:hypothetical protein
MLGHSLAVRAHHQMMRNCQPEQLLKLVPVMGVTIVLAGSLVICGGQAFCGDDKKSGNLNMPQNPARRLPYIFFPVWGRG